MKGKEEAVAILEPVDKLESIDAELAQELSLLDSAYQDYLSQNWVDTRRQYQQLLDKNPSKKLYEIYLERIEHLEQNPPEKNWDGSFTHTSK